MASSKTIVKQIEAWVEKQIKGAIENERLVVTLTECIDSENSLYAYDSTKNEIVAAIKAGKRVVMVIPSQLTGGEDVVLCPVGVGVGEPGFALGDTLTALVTSVEGETEGETIPCVAVNGELPNDISIPFTPGGPGGGSFDEGGGKISVNP